MMLNNIKVSKNFTLAEFESPDTHEVMVHPELITNLQTLRNLVGQPLVINSAYRTQAHNKAVGGVENSQHRLGTAVDIHLPDDLTADEMEMLAEKAGFTGIGKYNTFIHVDVRPNKARWDYRGQE